MYFEFFLEFFLFGFFFSMRGLIFNDKFENFSIKSFSEEVSLTIVESLEFLTYLFNLA